MQIISVIKWRKWWTVSGDDENISRLKKSLQFEWGLCRISTAYNSVLGQALYHNWSVVVVM